MGGELCSKGHGTVDSHCSIPRLAHCILQKREDAHIEASPNRRSLSTDTNNVVLETALIHMNKVLFKKYTYVLCISVCDVCVLDVIPLM